MILDFMPILQPGSVFWDALDSIRKNVKKIIFVVVLTPKQSVLQNFSPSPTENTRVDKVPLPRGAYAILYNTCVISDVFWSFQIFWGPWMRK